MTFILTSGTHDRKHTPVRFCVPTGELPGGELCVKLPDGRSIPAACEILEGGQAEICFVVPFLPSGETLPFTLESCDCPPQMACEKTGRGVDLIMRGGKFTEYYTRPDLPKPYLGPLFEAYGGQMTRLDLATSEHPHHRSLWVAQDEVNGVGFWNEPKKIHGYIRNQSVDHIVNGGAYTAFTANNLWTDHDGGPVMNESTRFTLYNTPREAVLLDIDITYTAAFGEVALGPTKEGGPLAVRMSAAMSVHGGTGTMRSGAGGVNEPEVWMRRAPWLDYSGTVDTHSCGIAMLDHPDNYGFPTHWHARDTGLMAANNFLRMGGRNIQQGESIRWKFRIVIHNGGTDAADIQGKFEDFAFPPAVEAAR